MANKKNQHYVPKFYFRYFSQNAKSICVLNRKDGLTFQSAPIKGQASKDYFYGDAEIENTLEKIDTSFCSALQKIRTDLCFKKCTPENYALLIQHIALQRSRTMRARETNKPIDDKQAQLYVEYMVRNYGHQLPEETRDMFLDNIQNAEAKPEQAQLSHMQTALECAGTLCDLFPVILQNKTTRPFIFCDAPVVFINPYLKKVTSTGVLGAQSHGLIILYPIGTQYSIMLIDDRKYRMKNR